MIVSIAISVVLWGTVAIFFRENGLIVNFANLKFIPLLAIAFGVLSALVPSVFQMGVEGWSKSSTVDKVQPLIFITLVLYGISMISQTYVTAIFASYLLGLCTSYLGTMIIPKR